MFIVLTALFPPYYHACIAFMESYIFKQINK